MVEQNSTSIVGFFWWGQENFPDYALSLMDDGTFKTYKSPDSDYDRPMTP